MDDIPCHGFFAAGDVIMLAAMDDEQPRVLDEYEARYMEGGASLARSKQRMPWWFFAIMGLALVAHVGAMVASASLVGLVTVPLLLMVTLLLSHLRLSVTATHVHVQLGMFGPTIPLAAVESVEAIKYSAMRFGGWGIRYGGGGRWAYSVPGSSGDAVEIVWTDAGGGRRTHVVTCEDGPAMARAIAAGRSRARGESQGVRIAAEDRVEGAEEAAEEVGAEAETRAQGRKRG